MMSIYILYLHRKSVAKKSVGTQCLIKGHENTITFFIGFNFEHIYINIIIITLQKKLAEFYTQLTLNASQE